MKKYVKMITAYDLSDSFTVEVENADCSFEFYLHHKSSGDKMYMFGLPSLDGTTAEEIIEANAEVYITLLGMDSQTARGHVKPSCCDLSLKP